MGEEERQQLLILLGELKGILQLQGERIESLFTTAKENRDNIVNLNGKISPLCSRVKGMEDKCTENLKQCAERRQKASEGIQVMEVQRVGFVYKAKLLLLGGAIAAVGGSLTALTNWLLTGTP